MSWIKVTNASELKIGDRVKFECSTISIEGILKTMGGGGLGYDNWTVVDRNGGFGFGVHDVYKLINKTMENLQQGDILVDRNGDERKVLGVCGEVYFLSYDNKFDVAFSVFYTLKELREFGYKLKEEESETIMVDGKTYKKEDVVERLKELEEIK